MAMNRRKFLSTAGVVAATGGAAIASEVAAIDDNWGPTAHIGYVSLTSPPRLCLMQKWVNTRTGSAEWRHFADVTQEATGKKPGEA